MISYTVNIDKGVGLDDNASRFLRDGARQLSQLITHIVNLSIESSNVPQDLKLAKVIPLFKKNSRLEIGNYRPVSLLSTVSFKSSREKYLRSTRALFEV